MATQQVLPGTAPLPPSPLAVQLFEDWNHWRKQTRQFAVLMQKNEWAARELKSTPERLDLFEKMIPWCRARHLEPRLWLMCLFKIRMWTFAPQLTEGSLMSENMIPKAKRQRGLGILRTRIQQTNRQAHSNEADPNRDVIHSVEALKFRYANENASARCLDEILEKTMGFHPKSPICLRCPLSGKCALALQAFVCFDVHGLRAGRITAEEAERQAHAGS